MANLRLGPAAVDSDHIKTGIKHGPVCYQLGVCGDICLGVSPHLKAILFLAMRYLDAWEIAPRQFVSNGNSRFDNSHRGNSYLAN